MLLRYHVRLDGDLLSLDLSAAAVIPGFGVLPSPDGPLSLFYVFLLAALRGRDDGVAKPAGRQTRTCPPTSACAQMATGSYAIYTMTRTKAR